MSTITVANLYDKTTMTEGPTSRFVGMNSLCGVSYDQSTPVVNFSVNNSSVTDSSTGKHIVIMTTPATGTGFVGVCHQEPNTNANPCFGDLAAYTATSLSYDMRSASGTSTDQLCNIQHLGEFA